MSSENYKLYRKNKVKIFNMIYDVWKNAPVKPILGFSTQEEEEQYNKKLDEYLEKVKPEIVERLKELGFGKEIKV